MHRVAGEKTRDCHRCVGLRSNGAVTLANMGRRVGWHEPKNMGGGALQAPESRRNFNGSPHGEGDGALAGE